MIELPIVDVLDYKYEIKKTAKWITTNRYDKISLQFPDNMLCDSFLVCKALEELTSKKIFISVDTTYSNCCIDETSAKHVDAEALVHYGRSCFSPTNASVYYVHPKEALNFDSVIEALSHVDTTDTVLVYQQSYEHVSDSLAEALFAIYPHLSIAIINLNAATTQLINGRIVIGSHGGMRRIRLEKYKVIYIGRDDQTLFNLAISLNCKSLFMMDLINKTTNPYSQSTWLKRRRFIIEKCKDATNIGILVCTLSIKNFTSIINRMKKLIKLSKKNSYVLTVGKPNIAKLCNLHEIDIFVLIACPENDLYSNREFLQPIAYPYELEMALNSSRNQYSTDYLTNFNDLLTGDIMANPESDVSFITGRMKIVNDDDVEEEEEEEEGKETDGTVNILRSKDWALTKLNIANHLTDRTWTGLQQKLGETEVEKAQQGRSGIPGKYANEL